MDYNIIYIVNYFSIIVESTHYLEMNVGRWAYRNPSDGGRRVPGFESVTTDQLLI